MRIMLFAKAKTGVLLATLLGIHSRTMAVNAARPQLVPAPQVVTAAVSEMLTMFQSRDVKQQATIIRERYSPDARFTDPLMTVKGHKDIALEFYSLIKLFSVVDLQQQDLTVYEEKNGVYEADVKNHQTYETRREGFFSKHLMPAKVEINVTTKLEVQKDTGKIISHTEVWHDKSVPVPGFAKPFMGGSTALLFKILGWGKIVDAKQAAADEQPRTS